jgi:hypothetical protein
MLRDAFGDICSWFCSTAAGVATAQRQVLYLWHIQATTLSVVGTLPAAEQ